MTIDSVGKFLTFIFTYIGEAVAKSVTAIINLLRPQKGEPPPKIKEVSNSRAERAISTQESKMYQMAVETVDDSLRLKQEDMQNAILNRSPITPVINQKVAPHTAEMLQDRETDIQNLGGKVVSTENQVSVALRDLRLGQFIVWKNNVNEGFVNVCIKRANNKDSLHTIKLDEQFIANLKKSLSEESNKVEIEETPEVQQKESVPTKQALLEKVKNELSVWNGKFVDRSKNASEWQTLNSGQFIMWESLSEPGNVVILPKIPNLEINDTERFKFPIDDKLDANLQKVSQEINQLVRLSEARNIVSNLQGVYFDRGQEEVVWNVAQTGSLVVCVNPKTPTSLDVRYKLQGINFNQAEVLQVELNENLESRLKEMAGQARAQVEKAAASSPIKEEVSLMSNAALYLASRAPGKRSIVSKALEITGVNNLNVPINNISEDRINRLINFYRIDGKIDKNQLRILNDLCLKIYDIKNQGMHRSVGHTVMLELFKELNQKDLNVEEKNVLAEMTKRLENQSNNNVLVKQIFQSQWKLNEWHLSGEALTNEQKNLDDSLDCYSDTIMSQAKQYKNENDPIGVMMDGGWAQHHINVEVIATKEGRFQFVLANAGDGVNKHKKLSENMYVTTQVFEVASEVEARRIVKEIAALTSQSLPSGPNTFYKIFSEATIVDDHGILARPIQTIGNCTLRNQQESFYYICQRIGVPSLANKFQALLIEVVEKKRLNNPSLNEQLKSSPINKAEITPLDSKAPKLVLTLNNTKHIVRNDFVIGRWGEIKLPNNHGLSRYHAQLTYDEKKMCYILSAHKNKADYSSLTHNGKDVQSGDQISLKSGDVITFGVDDALQTITVS